MLSDEEIDKELKEAIDRYAKKEVKQSKLFTFYVLGFQTATIIVLVIALLKLLFS